MCWGGKVSLCLATDSWRAQRPLCDYDWELCEWCLLLSTQWSGRLVHSESHVRGSPKQASKRTGLWLLTLPFLSQGPHFEHSNHYPDVTQQEATSLLKGCAVIDLGLSSGFLTNCGYFRQLCLLLPIEWASKWFLFHTVVKSRWRAGEMV